MIRVLNAECVALVAMVFAVPAVLGDRSGESLGVKTARGAREVSGVKYYEAVSYPLRALRMAGGRVVVGISMTPTARLERRLRMGQPGVQETGTGWRRLATEQKRREALEDLSELIGRLERRGQNRSAPVPLSLLRGTPMWGSAPPGLAKARDAEKAYTTHPSSLLALIYLEKALIQRSLGQTDRYAETLAKARGQLKLAECDFTGYVEARKGLPEWGNFGRPECCILYLSGELARQNSEPDEARKHYLTSIRIAPGDPYSWEAFVRLTMLPNVSQEVLDVARASLLKCYPCVWGCDQWWLDEPEFSREEFVKQFPKLVEELARSVMNHEQPKPGHGH